LPSSADVLAFHRRFWAPAGGDSEAAIAAAEQRLGAPLPGMLRAFYAATSLRHSQQIHLLTLPELHVADGRIVFASEQQDAFGWSVPPSPHDPELAPGFLLSDWLRFFTLINRPFEPPYAHDCVAGRPELPGWECISFDVPQLGAVDLHVLGGAVSDGMSIGAVGRGELIVALQSLDLEEDDVEIFE